MARLEAELAGPESNGVDRAALRQIAFDILKIAEYKVVVHYAANVWVTPGHVPRAALGSRQVTIEVKGEWVRWRLCEMKPPPLFINLVSVADSQQWHFIGDNCKASFREIKEILKSSLWQ